MIHSKKNCPYTIIAFILYTSLILGLCGGSVNASTGLGNPAPIQSQNIDMIRIFGRVDHAPAGAAVQALHADRALAGEIPILEGGRFSFPPLQEKAYTLRVVDFLGVPLPLTEDSETMVIPGEVNRFAEYMLTVESVPQVAPSEVMAQSSGGITGTVTAADTGFPIQFVVVEVYSDYYGYIDSIGYTDTSGEYSLTGLAAGSYKLHFRFTAGQNSLYSPEWYDSQADNGQADEVVVSSGEVTSGIDATLEVGGKISGLVTAAAGGASLAEALVEVYEESGTPCSPATFCSPDAFAYANSGGEYTVTGLEAGNYKVRFSASDYLPIYYDNQTEWLGADLIRVTLGQTTGDIDAALTLGGAITGHVTDADGGAPLGGAYVYAFDSRTAPEVCYDCPSYVAMDQTDASGAYSLGGLPGGDYYVKFDKTDYLLSYYNGHSRLLDTDSVGVTATQTTPDIDAALTLGGRISGHVTASVGGAPLAGIDVYAYDSPSYVTGSVVAQAKTDINGDYAFSRLTAGQYYVVFVSNQYSGIFYNNKSTLATANPVPVILGQTTPNIDASLDALGMISGVVTDAETGLTLAGVYVDIVQWINGSYDSIKNYGLTDSLGKYVLAGLDPGEYSLLFSKSGYLESYYDGKSSWYEADRITVALNSTVGHVDSALSKGGIITGKVTASVSGQPLEDAQVCAGKNPTFFNCLSGIYTDSTGAYRLTGLESGTYYLQFTHPDYALSYYNNKRTLAEADPVSVTIGQVTTNIDAALEPGSRIQGRVTSAEDGSPLEGITVHAEAKNIDLYTVRAVTNASGEYVLSGLLAGSYIVRFQTPSKSDYISEYYPGTPDWYSATQVTVGLDTLIDHIDASLLLGGRISGQVTGEDGLPLSFVDVAAMVPTTFCGEVEWDYVRSAPTDANGQYTIHQLPSGTYRVAFWPSYNSMYLGEYYNDKPTLEDADIVTVTAPETTSGIDASLREGGAITGRVIASDTGEAVWGGLAFYGSGLADWTDIDRSTGKFQIGGLEPGSYKLYINPYDLPYAPEFYDHKITSASADTIEVTYGEVVSDLHVTVSPGGRFTGQVTSASTGAPLQGVEVVARNSEGVYMAEKMTDSQGHFTTSELATGSYYLEFSPYASAVADYMDEYYDGSSTLESADLLEIAAPADTEANVSLDLGGAISGHVRDALTGTPLPDFNVSILDAGKNEVRSLYTGESGYYWARGLPAGTYYVHFYKPLMCSTNLFDLYYNQEPDLASADPVEVFLQGLHTGVDAFITQNYFFFPLIWR